MIIFKTFLKEVSEMGMRKAPAKRQQGFTLIEFILVLGLFAIILGGIFFLFRTGESTTQAEAVAAEGRAFLGGVQNYYIDNQRQYPTADCTTSTNWATGTCLVLKGYVGDEAVNAGWTYSCTSGGNPTVKSPAVQGTSLEVVANKLTSSFSSRGWSCSVGTGADAGKVVCTNTATCP